MSASENNNFNDANIPIFKKRKIELHIFILCIQTLTSEREKNYDDDDDAFLSNFVSIVMRWHCINIALCLLCFMCLVKSVMCIKSHICIHNTCVYYVVIATS